MFNIGFQEMIVLAALALIFIGPKELPQLARTLGRFLNELRRSTDSLKDEFKTQHLDQHLLDIEDQIKSTRKKVEPQKNDIDQANSSTEKPLLGSAPGEGEPHEGPLYLDPAHKPELSTNHYHYHSEDSHVESGEQEIQAQDVPELVTNETKQPAKLNDGDKQKETTGNGHGKGRA